MHRLILILSTSILCTAGLAGSLSAQENRSFSDLMYLPNYGNFFIQPEFTYSKASASIYENGALNSKNTAAESLYGITAGFGATDSIAILLKGKYGNMKLTSTDDTGDTQTNFNKGVYDPYFLLKCRPSNAFSSYLRADITAGFSPGIIKSKTSSQNTNGSNGRGGHAFLSQLDLGMKIFDFSFMLSASGEFFTKQTNKSSSATMTSTGGHILKFGGMFQFQILKLFQFRAGPTYKITRPIEMKAPAYGQESTVHQNTAFIGTVGCDIIIVPEVLLIGADYSYYKIKDYNVDTTFYYIFSSTFNTTQNKQSDVKIYARIQF